MACGVVPNRPRSRPPTSSIERFLLPTGRSALAIAAGYLGLFALLLFPAPVALVVGFMALADLNRHPEKLGRGRAMFGVIMGAVFSVFLVWTIVAVMLNGLSR